MTIIEEKVRFLLILYNIFSTNKISINPNLYK